MKCHFSHLILLYKCLCVNSCKRLSYLGKKKEYLYTKQKCHLPVLSFSYLCYFTSICNFKI